jgi:hypothetical protein
MGTDGSLKPAAQPKNPTELLEKQVQIQASLYQLLLKQHDQLEQLRTEQHDQSERLAAILEVIKVSVSSSGPVRDQVKIIGIDMPFMPLFEFILKVAVAAIPAFIVLLILVAAVLQLLGVMMAFL